MDSAGAVITANSSSMSMFLGGRWLTGMSIYERPRLASLTFPGFGCSAAGMAAKLYIAEIAPPKSRGAWMGVLNSFYYVGQILASGVAVRLFLYHHLPTLNLDPLWQMGLDGSLEGSTLSPMCPRGHQPYLCPLHLRVTTMVIRSRQSRTSPKRIGEISLKDW